MAIGTLYIVAAPSGAGKTSLVKAVMNRDPHIVVSVSHTTRPRREEEAEGENYHFVSEETFNDLLEKGLFLEHAVVFGHQSGTSSEWVEMTLQAGHDVILEIDWQGAQQVRSLLPTKSIFILPPSKEELLRRLTKRAQDEESVISHRMELASAELEHHQEFDYLVVNDAFEEAVSDILAIVRGNRCRLGAQTEAHKALIGALLSIED